MRLVVLLAAAATAAGDSSGTIYVSFTSGASCEANGAGSITTLADCSAAAAALGLSDTPAEDDGSPVSVASSLPPYCYVDDGHADVKFFSEDQGLMFHSAGMNTW